MDSIQAMLRGEAATVAGAKHRVFDWHKAARRIRESGAKRASAGLSGDWEYTGGLIFSDGKPVPKEDTYVYLCSNWATPELELDGDTEDCWIYSGPETNPEGWDANTYWPDSARRILGMGESHD